MQNTFDNDIHPLCEEDLIYPDEASEIFDAEEAKERRKEQKRQWRKQAYGK